MMAQLVALLIILGLGCRRDKDVETAETDVFELPSGATASFLYDAQTLELAGIAPSELSMELVDFAEEDDPSIDGVVVDLGGAILDLGPDGTVFPKPIYVQVDVPKEHLSEELPTLTLARLEEDRWRALPTMIEESSAGVTLTAQVDHFSELGVYATVPRPREMRVTTPIARGEDGIWTGELTLTGLSSTEHLSLEVVELEGEVETGEPLLAFCPAVSVIDVPLKFPKAGLYRLQMVIRGVESDSILERTPLEFWSRKLIADEAIADEHDATIEALADRYLPVVQFASANDSPRAAWEYGGIPAELWRPVAFDETWFSEDLTVEGAEMLTTLLYYNNLVTEEAQDALAGAGSEQSILLSRAWWDISFVSTAWMDDNPGAPGEDEIVIYRSAHRPGDDRLYLTYWMFYLHDPKTNAADESGDGAHDRDRESITVVLSEDTLEPIEVMYAQHNTSSRMSTGDAEWLGDALVLPWSAVDRYGTHPMAYIAGGSHAVYPRQRDYLVEVGFLYLLEAVERAGGGVTYCPTEGCRADLSRNETFEDVNLTTESIRLEPLPPMSQVDGVSSEWRHLWFSGYWVDGTVWYNDRFPPFLDRYSDPAGWRTEADARNEEDFDLTTLGPATIIEDCWNGEDDDGDRQSDCIDSDCAYLQYDYTEEFEIADYSAIDILFVVDQSCSMEDDTYSIAAEFSSFIDRLELVTTDWQIIVGNNDEGCNQGGILTTETTAYESTFRSALRECESTYGCSSVVDTEALLIPATNGVENTDSGECNEGFLRDDARLHVIAVSDEPDQSACDIFDVDCTDSDWENLVDRMIDQKGSPELSRISAVVGDLPDGCTSASNSAEPGTGYAEAVEATGGELLSLCSSWSDNVLALADASTSYSDTFALEHTPVEETITVTINDEERDAGWEYDASLNVVIFSAAPPEGGDLLVIRYTSSAVDCE